MTSYIACFAAPSLLAVAVLLATTGTAATEQKPNNAEGKDIAFTTADLGDQALFVTLQSTSVKVRKISITGKLGGKGHLGLIWNPAAISVFGDAAYAFDAIPKAWPVELKPLAIPDPQNRKRKLYEITGAPIQPVSLRLVVPTEPNDAPRLLVVDGKKGDTVLRVITLENITK